MAEYYSKEQLLECRRRTWCDMYDLDDFLTEVPIADVAEVVRCKDCIHRRIPTRCSLWMGTSGDNDYFREHGDDFFCAFGERTPKNDEVRE